MAEQMLSPAETVAAVIGAAGGVPLIGKAIAYLLRRRDAARASREDAFAKREADLERREEEQTARLEARAKLLEDEDRQRDLSLSMLRGMFDRYRIAFQIASGELARIDPASFALTQARGLLAEPLSSELPADMSEALAKLDGVS